MDCSLIWSDWHFPQTHSWLRLDLFWKDKEKVGGARGTGPSHSRITVVIILANMTYGVFIKVTHCNFNVTCLSYAWKGDMWGKSRKSVLTLPCLFFNAFSMFILFYNSQFHKPTLYYIGHSHFKTSYNKIQVGCWIKGSPEYESWQHFSELHSKTALQIKWLHTDLKYIMFDFTPFFKTKVS